MKKFEYKQLYPMPQAPNISAKWINIYRTRENISGKEVELVGGITNYSFLHYYVNKSVFGSPEKRMYREETIRNGKEGYIRKKFIVLRDSFSKKYIIDNYFATRVLTYYCQLKGTNLRNYLRKTKMRFLNGHELIGFLTEIKGEIRKRNKKCFDKFGVPKISINHLNRLIDYLKKEFDLDREVKILHTTKRIYLTDKSEILKRELETKLNREFGHTDDTYIDIDDN